MSLRRVLSIGLLMIAPVHAAFAVEPAPVESTPEVIALRFGWPVGLKASVESRSERTRPGRPALPFQPVMYYDIAASKHEKGLRIAYSNARVEGLPPEPHDPQTKMVVATLTAMSQAIPDAIIGPQGEFIGVVDVDRAARAAAAAFAPVFASAGTNEALQTQLQATLRQMVSPANLQASLAQDWNAVVGSWAGADLALGAGYEVEAVEPIPMLGGAQIPMRTQLGIVGRVPCHGGDTEERCVRIEAHTRPEPEATRAAIEDFVQKMAEALSPEQMAARPQIEAMEVTTEVVLVTEPATLIPHSLETRRITRVQARSPEGSLETSEGRDDRSYVYRYADR